MKASRWLLPVLVLIGLAFLAGWLLAGRASDDLRRWAQADALRLDAQRRAAEAPLFLPIRVLLYAGLAVVGVAAAGVAVYGRYLYVRRRARTIYPDGHGVMPALLLEDGESPVDLGALAGPLLMGPAGPQYQLPPEAVPRLQGQANQGAGATRAMRAWATHKSAPRETPPPPPPAPLRRQLPPVEVLQDGDAHVLRLLNEGER